MKVFSRNIHHVAAMMAALSFSSFFFLVLPLQTFLGNKDMFAFGLNTLLRDCVPIFILSLIIVFLVCLIGERYFGFVLHVLFLWIAICGYLETGLLSIGLPNLNGGLNVFGTPSVRRFIDLGTFLILLFLFVFLYHKIRGCFSIVAAGFLIMSVASIFDAKSTVDNQWTSPFDDGFCPKIDVARSAYYSTNKNVIVLCLDAGDGRAYAKAICGDADLKKKFVGFVAYSNNFSTCMSTMKALPCLLTGRLIQPGETCRDHVASSWREDSFLYKYLSSGYDMFINLALFNEGYTNRRLTNSKNYKVRTAANVWREYTISVPFISFYDIVVFRFLPYRFKYKFVLNALYAGAKECNGEGVTDVDQEIQLYPILSNAAVKPSVKDTFHFYHTRGTHTPITKDRHGDDLGYVSEKISDVAEYSHFLLEQLAKLFDEYKRKGVYDNSLIIVTTDHGLHFVDDKYALLWVKPIGCNVEFQFSPIPTSHQSFSKLLSLSIDGKLDRSEMDALLNMPERKYVKALPSGKWYHFNRVLDNFVITYDKDGREIARQDIGEALFH